MLAKLLCWGFVVGTAAILCTGCERPAPTPPLQAAPQVEQAQPPAAPRPADPAPPEMVREEAAVGAGEKGREIGSGIVATPVKTYFTAQEQIAFNVQVPQAMQLFRATHDRDPQSHDEFMQQIIRANRIELPQLPEGHSYVYDPETATLMVEQPAP